MPNIESSLPLLIETLENKKPIICDSKGRWRVVSKPERLLRKINKSENKDQLLLAYRALMKKVEAKNFFFKATPEVMEQQTKFYSQVLEGARLVVDYTKKSRDDKVKTLSKTVALAAIKLKYLIQHQNGGLSPVKRRDVDQDLIAQLTKKVQQWQLKDEKYEYTQPIDFTAKIKRMCLYPEIVKYLLKKGNDSLLKGHLQVALRDNFSIKVLSQYHFESEVLTSNFIGRRAGALSRRDIIAVSKHETDNGAIQKKLTLLMENKRVNLLDKKQKITFSNGLTWSIAKIYKDFSNKNDNPGDLEIFRDGVIPFNGHECAPRIKKAKSFWQKLKIVKFFFKSKKECQHIDSTKPNWFEDLPVLDIRSAKYIKNRYKLDNLEPGKWVCVLETTRRDKLDVDKAHGYSVYYQPLEDGTYRVYSFGAFPKKFPQNVLELLNFVGKTVKGTVAHDPNYYYSQSQHASKAFVVEENVGRAVLNELGARRALGISFQLGWENCIYFVRNVFMKVFAELETGIEVPDYFRKKFSHAKPTGALKLIQKLFDKVPKKLLPAAKRIVGSFFRASRVHHAIENGEEVEKSLLKTPFFEDLLLNLPSAFHHRIEKDRRRKEADPDYEERYGDCVLNYGHAS